MNDTIDSEIKIAFEKAEKSFMLYQLQLKFINDLVIDVEINYREVIKLYKKYKTEIESQVKDEK